MTYLKLEDNYSTSEPTAAPSSGFFHSKTTAIAFASTMATIIGCAGIYCCYRMMHSSDDNSDIDYNESLI